MPLPALTLWPDRQPFRPRLVGGRRGGGPSSVAAAVATHRLGVVVIAPSPHACFRRRASPLQIQSAKTRPSPVPF